MNLLQYILTFIVAPLIVSGIGAAIGVYVAVRLLKQEVGRVKQDLGILRKDFNDHKGVAVVAKDCEVCQKKLDDYHEDALKTAEFIKQEALNTAKRLEQVTAGQIDRVMDGLTNLSEKIDTNHVFLTDVAAKQITMAEDVAGLKALVTLGRK